MLKITHKARVKFSIVNYIDTMDCDVAPLSTCHLLLGQPWQFDLDVTHGGRSNTYSFPAVRKKKKDLPLDTPKPRMALLEQGENDVTITGPKYAHSTC
jgi:hypothetical protein